MGKTNFDRLMKRYLSGQLSEQERIKIDAWLDIMKTGDTDNFDMTAEDEEKLFRKITSHEDNIKEIRAFRPWRKDISPGGWIMRIAAGLLVISVVSYSAWNLLFKEAFFSGDSSAKVEKIMLNDGSLVWVRGDSRLTYYERPEGRYAELHGEALFEVTKDASRPFTIQYKEVSIRVVGTSFSVKTGDSVELNVLTGKVHVSSETDKTGVDVEPNEKVIYTTAGGIEKYSLPQADVAAVIANTTYNMKFSNVTLREAAEGIAKKFDVVIRIEDKQAGACRITADLTDHALEESLQMLTEILEVEYHRDGKGITISGKGC